jgi:hypothetical protein
VEWCGFLVGFFVGWGCGAWVVGGGGGGAVVVWTAVGVAWVGAATADRPGVPPDPAALCGHQATRHAAVASNAATATRTAFVQVLLTTSSRTP